jgi:adenine-specific DNA methylase
MFAIEYYNPKRKDGHSGRFFKRPDAKDLKRAKAASTRWHNLEPRFTPQQEILPGDETDRLHRRGYRHYRDLFNDRQLLGLEASCKLIVAQPDQRIRRALATNLSDLLRYQNMLCRYDTMALKSLDIFSVHGFPVGLAYCESGLLGIINGNGINVGSGGWVNIIDKYAKAKRYCDAPFEVIQKAGRKINVPITGEWIGERLNGGRRRNVSIRCTSSTTVELAPNSLDAVFTDPPYFGNVQYGELMDFCYVWLRQLVSNGAEGFDRLSTRSVEELTGNQTESRGLEEFAEGLAAVYGAMGSALKPGAPLAFTFHHNRLEAYETVAVAILDAGLTCSMTLPCPAEMGGSIHIHGTGSSVVDTVFVCRANAAVPYQQFSTLRELTSLVRYELDQLRSAGLKVSAGDIRCVVYGHLTHMAIWKLRSEWDMKVPTVQRLRRVRVEMNRLGDFQSVINELSEQGRSIFPTLTSTRDLFEDSPDAISF